jgi:hypothetical protein
MKVFSLIAFAVAVGALSVGTCLADIAGVLGTGTTATLLQPSTGVTFFDGNPFPTAVISDDISLASSNIAFAYTPPPDYGVGDRLIVEVINGTGSTLTNIDFTLAGLSGPQYYDAPTGTNPPYPGVPSAGLYQAGPNTYTTTADLSGDLNPGRTGLNVPLTLAAGQEQDFYFAVNYVGTPASFTITQEATTPEPSFYADAVVMALGLTALLLVASRRRKTV